jgi:nucleotide-binding universal stress UspA family protein
MKRILIALDYDPTAQKVAETGELLCNLAGDLVTLLHVIDSPSYYISAEYNPIMGFSGYINPELPAVPGFDQIIGGTEKYLQKTRAHLGHPEMKTLVKEGNPGEIILATAGEMKADVIIMGSHSRRSRERIPMGNTATYVSQHTRIPVLIVPTGKAGFNDDALNKEEQGFSSKTG